MKKILIEELLKRWGAPTAAAGAATQSEDSDAAFLGLLAKGASKKGADAAKKVFDEHMATDPSIFTNPDTLSWSGAMQSQAAREAGNSRQGWFIGADGQPRYEISDANASIDQGLTKGVAEGIMGRLSENTHLPVPLGDFLTHDSLFNAYPEMRDIPVMLQHPRDMGNAMAAYFNPGEGLEKGGISMNLQSIVDHDRNETVRSLMHEVQHAIQQKEGFNRGAGMETAMDDVKDYMSDPGRHGVLLNDQLAERKMRKLGHLADMDDPSDPARQEFGREFAYNLSAGESEARAVEQRLRQSARDRADEFNHPYTDMNVPSYMLPEGAKGPTLFDMVEMMRRDY